MTLKQLHKKIQPRDLKIGNEPFVVIPLDKWYDIEDMLMMSNPKFQQDLSEAEKEIKAGKFVSLEEYHKKRKTKNG